MDEAREFTSLGHYVIKDRGVVITVINPGGLPDPRMLNGQEVVIDDIHYRVKGVEMFAVALPYPERSSARRDVKHWGMV